MDTFASVWDAADDVAADQSLRSLTSARMQVAPVWSFLAAATDVRDFGNRLALHEDRLHAAAAAHGVSVEDLAKSLADDFRTLKESSFYVEDGGEKVGGPYDTKADAQDAINGGDVEGDNLKVEQDGDKDGETNDDDDADDAPPAKAEADDDDEADDSDDDDKGGNPFAKKSALDEAFPVVKLAAGYHSVVHQPGETVFVDHFMGHDTHEGRKGVWATVVSSPGTHGHEDREDSHLLKPMAPGGTPFFHHFGGLAKQAMDYNMAREEHHYEFGDERFRTGVGSYPHPDESHGDPGNPWRPHRVYDSIQSAQNHLSDGPFQGSPDHQEHRDLVEQHSANLRYYNHCNSCDHVYTPHHPDHTTHGAKDQCPNCGDTDFHESVSDVLHDSGTYAHSSQRHHFDHDDHGPDYHGLDGDNYGDPYGKMDNHGRTAAKTALQDGEDPLKFVLMASPKGEGEAEVEAHHETSFRAAAALVGMYSDLVNDLKSE